MPIDIYIFPFQIFAWLLISSLVVMISGETSDLFIKLEVVEKLSSLITLQLRHSSFLRLAPPDTDIIFKANLPCLASS